jgi:hypothetical protein
VKAEPMSESDEGVWPDVLNEHDNGHEDNL